MQSRPPFSVAPARRAQEPELSVELAAVVASARRRAFRDGDRHIDTAHLLHGLLEADPEVRDAFDGGPSQVARLLGYLVQRTIGYGLRWSGTVEDSGAVPIVRLGDREAGCPGWSPAAASAMDGAWARARGRGAGRAEGLDLLALLARDGECRAAEVLRRAGVDPDVLVEALDGPTCQQSTG
ncbi:peptidase [Streptomyces sp. LX-29]|uniref:Clp protease N-terminal domain-containing protein n=1 Tax=Streptomyces sp. LX-29 TaxID=2900152 RepID=UPI00240D2771|nr:Clp protease N-terminal domain-containing protein [Streptomyces sp. LX-29]WFB06290.1 peptidase [Streptomyces sp. LX-29]